MSVHIYLFQNPTLPVTSFEDLRERSLLKYPPDISYWKWRNVITYLNLFQIDWECTYMPSRTGNNFSDWKFVNINLSAADTEKFTQFYSEYADSTYEQLAEVVSDGYKLSLSYDIENVCFIAALSGTKNTTLNKGRTITARSSDNLEAISLLLFKHLVMCNSEEWEDYSRPANWG